MEPIDIFILIIIISGIIQVPLAMVEIIFRPEQTKTETDKIDIWDIIHELNHAITTVACVVTLAMIIVEITGN